MWNRISDHQRLRIDARCNRMSVRRFGLVVLVVAGAGCSGLAPPAPDAPSPTVTAAPVPSAPPPPTPNPLPPGVEPHGVVDPPVLAAAHRTGLLNTSYTRTVTESTRRPNGAVIWQRTRVIKTDGARVFAVLTQSGSPLRDTSLNADHVELYTGLQPGPNKSAVSAAVTHDDGRTVSLRTTRYKRLLDNRWDLTQLLAVFETRVVSQDHRGETTVFELEATGPPVVDRFRFVPTRRAVSDPRNVTFRLLVDERGVVHRYHLTYTTTVEGRALRYERTVALSAIGSTTVGPPAWLNRGAGGGGQ